MLPKASNCREHTNSAAETNVVAKQGTPYDSCQLLPRGAEDKDATSKTCIFLARVETPCVRSAQVIFAKSGNSASSKRESKTRKQTPNKTPKTTKNTKKPTKNPREDHCRVSALYIMVTLCETRELRQLAIWASNSNSRCSPCLWNGIVCSGPCSDWPGHRRFQTKCSKALKHL